MKTKLLTCVISLAAMAGMASAGAPPAAGAAKAPAPSPSPSAKADTKMAPAPSPAAAGDKGAPPAAAPDMAAMFPKPGPETAAIAHLATNVTWTGKVPAGGMGPGTPEMATKGAAKCKWTNGKLWITCDVTDTMTAGKNKATLTGTMNLGWDFMAKAYRSTWVDSMGASLYMQGKLDGTKLVLESLGSYAMMGQPFAFRITWDWTDAKAPKLTQEVKMGAKGAWTLAEENMIKGLKAPAPAAPAPTK